MRNFLDKSCRENRHLYFILTSIVPLFSYIFMFDNFFPENCAVYEIMSKNMVEPEGPKMTSQYGASRYMLDKQRYTRARAYTCLRARAPARMRARTYRKYIILNAFPRQQWSSKRVSMHIACLVVD